MPANSGAARSKQRPARFRGHWLDRTACVWYYQFRSRETALAKRRRYEDAMLLVSGETVTGRSGEYVVERVVGMGGFAAVYFARDPAFPGRQIALKEFYPARHPREQANLQALWERERTVGMQASPHPLMPTYYDAFISDNHFYIAQEFIEGATLDEIIQKRRPLPREWTLKWAVSLCDALAFLHSRGVVHHDLKPANIRITPQGHLTLLDFGAAQYFGDGHANTKPIELYGTDGYLPPELDGNGQWVADARTDIFAVGAILYEMIAGIPPDQEKINERSAYVTSTLIQKPNADLGLVKLINKALSYNTEYRYASANDFLLEMRQIAPPVLLVSRKHLRWGEIKSGQPVPPKTVTLYNAGGGEIRGEVKPRSAWIVVPAQTFQGNRHEATVMVNPAKIAERGQTVIGRLEINTPDQRDEDNAIVTTGDRWFIECSITVLARSGHLTVRGAAGDGSPLLLSARKGQPATAEFEIVNAGETETDFSVESGPPDLITVTPLPGAGTLAPGERARIAVRTATDKLPAGLHEASLVVRAATGQAVPVALQVRVLSHLDFLKARLGRH